MCDYVFAFEKLKAWEMAKDLAISIYGVTQGFPLEEKFGLVSQLRRASVSIASNLAEASARQSSKDQAHFSQLAYSSLVEVVCQLKIASELGYLSAREHEELRQRAGKLSYMINALQTSQKKSWSQPFQPLQPLSTFFLR